MTLECGALIFLLPLLGVRELKVIICLQCKNWRDVFYKNIMPVAGGFSFFFSSRPKRSKNCIIKTTYAWVSIYEKDGEMIF